MYHVLLVDDEYYIRQRLATCIDWEDEGFTIKGSVGNADEAFHLLLEQSFDLAIVDISMPQKDGLTLIKELREHQISVKIMILSGYGTFEYAQRAIKYDITAYLLKPIDEDELLHTLGELKQTLDSEHELKQLHQQQYHAKHLLNSVKKENYFQKIFTHHPIPLSDVHALEAQLPEYNLTDKVQWRIIVFDLPGALLLQLSLEDIQLHQYTVANVLLELSENYFGQVHFAPDIFTHGVLICSQETSSDDIVSFLEDCIKKVKDVLHLDICFGYSPLFSLSLQNMNTEYNHALMAYVLSNLREAPYVLYTFSEDTAFLPFDVLRNLEKLDAAVSSGSREQLETTLDMLFTSIDIMTTSFLSLEQMLSRIVMICYNRLEQTPSLLTEFDDFTFLQGCKEILLSGYSLEYIQNKITQLFFSLTLAQPVSGSAKKELVQQAANYISAHYSRCDISLSLRLMSTLCRKVRSSDR